MQPFAGIPEPFINPGDAILASKLNALARGVRQQSLLPGAFFNGRLQVQSASLGGSSGTTFRYGEVTYIALADRGSIGKFVLLNQGTLEPEVELDPGSSEYSESEVEAGEVLFKSADFLDAQVGKRIMINYDGAVTPNGVELDPGASDYESGAAEEAWDAQPIFGNLVEYPSSEELTCDIIEVVTDVYCDEYNAVQQTKETFTIVVGPCPSL